MRGLDGALLSQAAEALSGLRDGAGPWWDASALGGAPLFGAVEGPFNGPAGALLAQAPWAWFILHALLLSGGLAFVLGLPRFGGLERRKAVLFSVALCGGLAASGPALLGAWTWCLWAALLVGSVTGAWAAPFCALAVLSGSPLLLLAAMLVGRARAVPLRDWALAWGLGLALAAPGLLEMLRLAPSTGSALFRAWPLGWLASPMLIAQAGVMMLIAMLLSAAGQRRAPLVLGAAAALLALGAPFFGLRPRATEPAASSLVQLGTVRRFSPMAALPAGPAERVVGPLQGLGPRGALQRWRAVAVPAALNPDLLSLLNVGWIDLDGGQTWRRPVDAAMVDGAVGPSGLKEFEGRPLFERPLAVASEPGTPILGTAWRTQEVRRPAPGAIDVELRGSMDHAWAFVSESFDSAWKARIHAGAAAREAEVKVAEGDFLAVALKQGDGRLQLRYAPPWLGIGLFVALLGFLGLFWAWKPRFGR